MALAGVSGYVYTFKVGGEKEKTGSPDGWNAHEKCGESGFVVLLLIEKLEQGKHKLFFDNFFSSPELIEYLASKGFWALATLNVNRSRKCPLPKEKELKKLGRGASTQNVNQTKSVMVTSWYDSKRILQHIALHLISQCAVNAWIICREMGGLKSYLDFDTEICVTLMAGKLRSDQSDEDQSEPSPPPPPPKRMKGSSVPETIRYDNLRIAQ